MGVTTEDISEAAREMGLSGRAVCVHSSLRSFGVVKGGAQTVVGGLLAEKCTILVPTFSWDAFAISPPHDMRPMRNGWNYEEMPMELRPGAERIYTPDTVEIDKDMGAIPKAVVSMQGRVRGDHPLCSFSAVGPLANELVAAQKPLHVYAPLEKLVEVDGLIVRMGVDSMTLLHLAEQRAGRNLFLRWANGPDGQQMQVEVGSCSDGFRKFENILLPLMKETKVGESLWRIASARAVLESATRAIQQNPSITHCADSMCDRCNDGVAGGPILSVVAA